MGACSSSAKAHIANAHEALSDSLDSLWDGDWTWWSGASKSWKSGGVAVQLKPNDEGLKLHHMASLGVVRLDYDYPPAPGDIDHPGSFGYDVYYRVVPGLTFGMCQSGKLTPEVEARFIKAIKYLDAKGVSVITADCGFFMNFQALARTVTRKPVVMSGFVNCM